MYILTQQQTHTSQHHTHKTKQRQTHTHAQQIYTTHQNQAKNEIVIKCIIKTINQIKYKQTLTHNQTINKHKKGINNTTTHTHTVKQYNI